MLTPGLLQVVAHRHRAVVEPLVGRLFADLHRELLHLGRDGLGVARRHSSRRGARALSAGSLRARLRTS